MTKRSVYSISWLLAVALITSCNINHSSSVEKPDNRTTFSGINKLDHQTIIQIKKLDSQLQTYHNQTKNQSTIGELLNEEFGTLKPRTKSKTVASLSRNEFIFPAGEKPVLKKSAWLLSINFDNDIFDNTDYYYTNGITIELTIPGMRHSPVNKIFPGPRNNDIEFYGVSLTQNIYTPTNPDTKNILYGDRPFSAYLTIGQYREVYDLSKNIYLKSQLNLGVIGPSSLGGEVQSSIHEITPQGWQNQINNDFVINYSVDLKKGLINSSVFDLNVNGNASIGSLYDKIGGGFDLRFGSFMPFYQGLVSVFQHDDEDNRLQCWFFVNSNIQLVAYDATLQGGLFSTDNIYTIKKNDINRIVFKSSMGFAVYHSNFGIEFENFFMTPEFKGARNFGWGRVKAVLAF